MCCLRSELKPGRSLSLQKKGDGHDGSFDTMHIRRGDFGTFYEQTKLSAEELYAENVAPVIKENRTVFIATDERDFSWFDPLKEHYNLLFLKDFEYLFPDLNPNYYGMLDQLIASMGDVFFGTYYSTFTGYINRMRGYHSQNKKAYGHQVGMIDSYYIKLKKLKLGYNDNESSLMRTYSAVEPPFWSREFPVCWRDIDHDVVI